MARIAGVNIPTNKRVLIALQYIHGIGQKNAAEIIEKVKIPEDRRVNQLSDQEVLQIREVIDRDYLVEGDLRRETGMNIKRLMDLGCYRGRVIAADCRSRSAYPYQCAHAQRPGQVDRGRRNNWRIANSEWRVVSIRYSPPTIRPSGVAAGITAAFEIIGKVLEWARKHPRTPP